MKRRMYKGKQYDKVPSTSNPVKRSKKWKPKPKNKKYHFGKKAKKESKVILCYQDKKKVCKPIQLRLAPPNLCSLTETKCKRLKRRRQTERRRSKTPTPKVKPKLTFIERLRLLRAGVPQ